LREILKTLKNSKNLLAFSAGVDSTALFFMLLENEVNFDIAIVNYGIREQAKEEIAYAKELAQIYNKKIYISNAPKFDSNFEKQARDFRYEFFEEIIQKYNYEHLFTAHQLNDKLEWLLMRLGKGAGTLELGGMQPITKKRGYLLIRPLLNDTKDELLEYLHKNSIKYFIDKSNYNLKFERNRYKEIVKTMLKNGKNGFVKSFDILAKESAILKSNYTLILQEKELIVVKVFNEQLIDTVASKYLKELGYLISGKERVEFAKHKSIVAGRKWALEFTNNTLYIAPYVKIVIPKEFKEKYRVAKIPPKIRGYIYKHQIAIEKQV